MAAYEVQGRYVRPHDEFSVRISSFFAIASPSTLASLIGDSKFADELTPAQQWMVDKAWDVLIANVGKNEAGKLVAKE